MKIINLIVPSAVTTELCTYDLPTTQPASSSSVLNAPKQIHEKHARKKISIHAMEKNEEKDN